MTARHLTAPTRFIEVDGARFAYPQVDLLGFSIGALQVQAAALRHPGLVRIPIGS